MDRRSWQRLATTNFLTRTAACWIFRLIQFCVARQSQETVYRLAQPPKAAHSIVMPLS
jgi:hypothetical protein